MRTIMVLLVLALTTASVSATPSVLHKNGACKLPVRVGDDDDKAVKVSLSNADVDVDCEFAGGDYVGKFSTLAMPDIKNKTGKHILITYQAAFFDHAGTMISCTEQHGDMEAGKSTTYGGCVAPILRPQFDKIVSYQVTVYVSEIKQ